MTLVGSQVVISGARVQKVDENDSSKGLNGAEFELYTDKDFKHRAQQAKLTAAGKPQFETKDGKSSLKMTDTGTYTSETKDGKDGIIVLDNLLPGTYYLKEVKAPEGYQTESNPRPIEVLVSGEGTNAAKVSGGVGESATVAKDGETVTAVADQFAGATTWASTSLNNVRVTAGTEETSALLKDQQGKDIAGSGVFVKNDDSNGGEGKSVTFTNATAPKSTTLLGSSSDTVKVTTTDMDKASSSENVADLAAAQTKVNDLIANNKLDASNALIAVDTGVKVYHKAIPVTVQTTITNKKSAKPQPVNVTLQARKHFTSNGKDQQITAGRFAFDLTPKQNDNAQLLSKSTLTAKVGADGKATWTLPQITSDIYEKATKNASGVASFNFTATEQKGDDKNITYSDAKIPVRIDVSNVSPADNNGNAGLKTEVFVDGTSKGSATSGKDAIDLHITNSGVEFTNVLKPSFEFTKANGSDHAQHLQGAGFTLYRCNAADKPCDVRELVDWQGRSNIGADKAWSEFGAQTSDADGRVRFSSLDDGEYRLVETKAPNGFTLPSGQWKVTVKNGVVSMPEAIADKEGNEPAGFGTPTGGGLELYNYKPLNVPSTGGRGLVLFASLGGGLLLAGATVVLIDSRRRKARAVTA
ncbi:MULTISPECIES: SpaA isopeptide-forming pilin-related protein [Bifidobacterium]|uniref:SpaA isopeptide-forming pilin-related protein n=1 Tax=Bifidobacterium TaxID=1678 RepID=UPI001FAE8F9B|nr:MULTISPECIES: SpaA isopeptide-forming pilin-related protein [Bifidobacterium]